MSETPHQFGLFIDGKWVTPEGSSHFETRNPATGEVLARFVSWPRRGRKRRGGGRPAGVPGRREVPAPDRGVFPQRAAQILLRRKDEVGRIVTREMGKILDEGRGDVQESIDFIEYMAGEGRRLAGETVPSELHNKFCLTVRQPKGVVACITPWTFRRSSRTGRSRRR